MLDAAKLLLEIVKKPQLPELDRISQYVAFSSPIVISLTMAI